MVEERISFQDMLEQARAQSNVYSAKEDSEDKYISRFLHIALHREVGCVT